MARHRTFVREEKYPSYFVNAQQDFLSVLAAGFVVTRLNTTTIRVPAGTGNDRAVVAVDGRYRWRDTNADRAHPGGAAGAYAIFAVASNNSVSNAPVSDTDLTNYNFDLRIVADGSVPAIAAGTVDAYRKVATCVWDGAQITRITQLVPSVGQHAASHATAGSDPLLLSDIGAASAAGLTQEIADRVAGDSPYAASRVVTWAGDTALYRQAAGVLKTDGNLYAGSDLVAKEGAAEKIALGSPLGGGLAAITFGSAGDTNLYRSAAGILKTDGKIRVAGDHLWVEGVGGLYLGATADVRLYRSAAATLKTDGALLIGGNVGFYNTAPIAKPNVTGTRSEIVEDINGIERSVGDDLTFGNLLTALASLGLITNSTTT